VAELRVGTALDSNATKGRGTPGEVGAAPGVLAPVGLLANHFSWWWGAHRVAALAVVAAAEVVRVLGHRPRGAF